MRFPGPDPNTVQAPRTAQPSLGRRNRVWAGGSRELPLGAFSPSALLPSSFQMGQRGLSLWIAVAQGQRAEQPLIKPQRVLCSVAGDGGSRAASLGWLLGGCWENPSVREREVWTKITRRSQFSSAFCSWPGERLWPLPFIFYFLRRNRASSLPLVPTAQQPWLVLRPRAAPRDSDMTGVRWDIPQGIPLCHQGWGPPFLLVMEGWTALCTLAEWDGLCNLFGRSNAYIGVP